MNRCIVVTVAVVLLGSTALADAQRKKKQKELVWSRSVAAAKEEARIRNVPIVLHIHGNT